MNNALKICKNTSLYEELNKKQIRCIKRDVELLCSPKGGDRPKSIKDLTVLGAFPIKITLGGKEVFLSKAGVISIKRISEFTIQSNKFDSLLSYDDIFKAIVTEIERWKNKCITPEVFEFLKSLDLLLSSKICDFSFVCRIHGVSLDGLGKIVLGRKEVNKYTTESIPELLGLDDEIKETIIKEFADKLVISGVEKGSQSIAQEKFYYNAELALSVLRLYSCVLYGSAINQVRIRLIDNNVYSYNRPSCFFRANKENSFTTLTGYSELKQDFKIDSELIQILKTEYFFNEFSCLIDKKEKNELENAVVKSLFWIGEAQTDRSYASVWINLWSCVECFFVFGANKVTERNASGISSILVYGGYSHEKYNDYKALKSEVTKYYGLRSKIVHHAEHTHINEKLLEELSVMVSWVIISIISLIVDRGYTTLAEIQKEAERLDKSNSVEK